MFGAFRSQNQLGPTSRVRQWTENQLSVAQTSVHEVGAVALLWHIVEPFDPSLIDSSDAGRVMAEYMGDSTLFEVTSYTTFKLDYWCHANARQAFGDAFMPYFMRFVASVFEREGQISMAGELLNSRMQYYADALRNSEPAAELLTKLENLVARTKGGRSPYKGDPNEAPLVVQGIFDRSHLTSFLFHYETEVFPLVLEKFELLAEEF